jgi:hypothetical protein
VTGRRIETGHLPCLYSGYWLYTDEIGRGGVKMKYYKIMTDGVIITKNKNAVCVSHIPVVEGQLLTKKELARLGAIGFRHRTGFYKPVRFIEISSHKTYFSFGCRFQERNN